MRSKIEHSILCIPTLLIVLANDAKPEVEAVMGKHGKAGLLVRDKEYVKFVQLLRKAEDEGRLDGKHTCMLCGMRFQTSKEAEECCKASMS